MDWKEVALRLESRVDLSRVPPIVRERLLLADPLYVACSGGADSVFTLLLVRLFSRSRGSGGELKVLHFNHDLRGADSEADAIFVKNLCDSLDIPFFESKWHRADTFAKVSEAAARDARYAFFREATESSPGKPTIIATGHHADDVVETLLMRLSRGSGLRGLTAPHEFSEAGGGLIFLRPILEFTRQEIRECLAAAAIRWREDATNESDANYRTRLRNRVIPVWNEAADRPVWGGVSRSRRLMVEDDEALDQLARSAWSEALEKDSGGLALSTVCDHPIAIQRRVLQILLVEDEATSAVLEKALDAISSGEDSKIEVAVGVFLEIANSRISRVTENEQRKGINWSSFVLPMGAIAYLPDGSRLTLGCEKGVPELLDRLSKEGNDDRKSAYLCSFGNRCEVVTVRRRLAGDAFKPLGKTSVKKLKTLFIDRKIAREKRDCLPVFVLEGVGIVWVPNLPPNGDCKLRPSDKSALRLTYER